jgi:glycosyltransferase involved in cell wall biosynthesis
MRIAVNTRLLLKNKLEGIGWFMYETLSRITTQHPEHEFLFIFDRPFDEKYIFSDNVKPVVVSPQARHPILFYLWFEFSIPYILKKYKADLFLSPDGYLSLSTKVKSLAVIHDLNFEHYPQDLPFAARNHYRYYFPKYARKAEKIATVSEYSKSDIIEKYKIDQDKIDVVYNGANEGFKTVDIATAEAIRNKYTNGNPYFVFVGALHPRKNLTNLFKAFDQFKQKDRKNVKLMIVGEKQWWTHDIKKAYDDLKFQVDVIFTGRLQIKELQEVVASALALTYVSYFEGFGIPIVEAFYAGTPVITSDITSMPEVAGDAALLIDPFSIDSISSAMEKMANNEELRNSLIEKGFVRANDFSWQQSADKLWGSIEKLL